MGGDPVSRRDWDDAHLIDVLYDLHEDDKTLGYRFLTDELADEHQITVGENRVHRLCRIAGITASHHTKRSKTGSTGPARTTTCWPRSTNMAWCATNSPRPPRTDAVDIGIDATGDSWNTTDLTWIDTAGEPVDEYETCALPEPGGVHSQVSVAEPHTGRYYLALAVVNQGDFVGIGCGGGQFLGFGACSTPPNGAPYLPHE